MLVGIDEQTDWGQVFGPNRNAETNARGIRLLEFSAFHNLALTNTFGPEK